MKKIKVTCECCDTEHYITRSEVGKALVKLRKTKNSVEHLRRVGALGGSKRWKKRRVFRGNQT